MIFFSFLTYNNIDKENCLQQAYENVSMKYYCIFLPVYKIKALWYYYLS